MDKRNHSFQQSKNLFLQNMNIFPSQSLLISEFEKIKGLVETACAGPGGQSLAKVMEPGSSFEEVSRHLARTEEFRKIISNSEPLHLEAYPDISQELKLLGIRNSVLHAGQFLQIKKLTLLMKHLFVFFKGSALKYPELCGMIADLVFEDAILEEIHKVLDENQQVRSNASTALASIRKKIERKRIEADQLYHSVMIKYRRNKWLTDNEESWRNGRRVISIYIEHKRSAKGVIHDISATGKTCYIEPDETIQVNNMLFELEEEEKQEIYTILKALTDSLRKYHSPLCKYAVQIAQYDCIAAKALVAIEMKAVLPFLVNKPQVDVREARHPLLYIYNKSTGKETVPFNLHLNEENRILVISGPNAGGKTVCMKTAGLLQVMLQSGMLVTTDENSRFGFFKSLLVDIGDSQSLEFELSTYSSRLNNMKVFLQRANENTFFLIDEFGTGTDPNLGGALAEAILEELNNRKSFGIITTHYMNLKVLADRTPGIINGSMAFDAKKLAPLFHLIVGKPGSSYTFVVAERSGIPYHVIRKAKSRVKKNSLQLEQTLNNLEREKTELNNLLTAARTKEEQLKQMTEKYRQNITSQEKNRTDNEERMKLKELRMVNQMESQLQRFMRDFKGAKNKKEVLTKYELQFNKRKKELTVKELEKADALLKYNQLKIKKGSNVRLKNGRVTGIVESIKDDKVHVRFGNVKSITELQNLIYIEEEK